MEVVENIVIDYGLDHAILKDLQYTLSTAGIPYIGVNYGVVLDKNELFESYQSRQGLIKLLMDHGVIFGPHADRTQIAVSRTITAQYHEKEFLVTTFGKSPLSRNERKNLLTTQGIDHPSRKDVERIVWNRDVSLLNRLGAGPGYVGPFLFSSTVTHVIVNRVAFKSMSYISGTPVLAEFALSPQIGILLPFEQVRKVIEVYQQVIRAGEFIYIESPDRTIF